MTRHSLLVAVALLTGCSSSGGGTSATVASLAVGDLHCPKGGVSVTSGGTTAYACNGADGAPGSAGAVGGAGAPGATGPMGPQGPIGGGKYVSRNDLYCNTKVATVADVVVTANCTTDKDLPLAGSCDMGSLGNPTLAHTLVVNTQRAWVGMNIGNPAGWDCGWAGATGALTAIVGAQSQICCVQVP